MTKQELKKIIDAAVDAVRRFDGTQADYENIKLAIRLAEKHTPIEPELVEISLDCWEPKAGDIVEWPNGESFEVGVEARGYHEVLFPDGDTWGIKKQEDPHDKGNMSIINAAKCRIWRKQ